MGGAAPHPPQGVYGGGFAPVFLPSKILSAGGCRPQHRCHGALGLQQSNTAIL